MRKLAIAMIMLFLTMFLSVAEDASAHGYIEPTWVENVGGGIVCIADGAYFYGVRVVDEDDNRKEVAMFPAGPNIMQAIAMRSVIRNNPDTLRSYYNGNGILTLHINVLFRYPSCDIETRRIKFVQQKTEP